MKNTTRLIFASALLTAMSSCSQEQNKIRTDELAASQQAIVNGYQTLPGEFDGIVAIVVQGHPMYSDQMVCTGTMITKRHVLTAAHCVAQLSDDYFLFSEDSDNPNCKWKGGNISTGAMDTVNYLKIHVGMAVYNGSRNVYGINKIYYHSGYSTLAEATACTEKNFSGYSVTRNDIAVLELEKDIDEEEVQPFALLPPWLGVNQDSLDHGLEMTFAGYGYNESGNRGLRRRVNIPVEKYCSYEDGEICPLGRTVHVKGCHPDKASCKKYGKLDYYDDNLAVPPGAFFHLQQSGGPCSGDSGGPVLLRLGNRTYVAGITSYGDNACAAYGVSTAVQDFYDWIVKIVPEVTKENTEICGNGLDDDNNGFTDIEDEACKGKGYCGDGLINDIELCDKDAFFENITDCSAWNFAYSAGTVGCKPDCTIDYSQCTLAETPDTCGNGQVDDGEMCDGDIFKDTWGTILETNSCSEYSAFFNNGELVCNSNCTIDTGECSSDIELKPICGDGVIQKGEICDLRAFKEGLSSDCRTWDDRYVEGLVLCEKCRPDFSECKSAGFCGDGELSPDEYCEGDMFTFNETSCAEWSSFMSEGKVKCNANCTLDLKTCEQTEQAKAVCGNGKLDVIKVADGISLDEDCDGTLFLKGNNCSDWDDRFDSGLVTCNDNCSVNLEKCVMKSHALYLDEDARSMLYLLNSNAKPENKAPGKANDTVVIEINGDLSEHLPGIESKPEQPGSDKPESQNPEPSNPSDDKPSNDKPGEQGSDNDNPAENEPDKDKGGCSLAPRQPASGPVLIPIILGLGLAGMRRKKLIKK